METSFLLQGICRPVRVGFKVENAALVSTKIWHIFPLILILVSPWRFMGTTGNSLRAICFFSVTVDYSCDTSLWTNIFQKLDP